MVSIYTTVMCPIRAGAGDGTAREEGERRLTVVPWTRTLDACEEKVARRAIRGAASGAGRGHGRRTLEKRCKESCLKIARAFKTLLYGSEPM
jgi:hypothetical protein